MRKADSDPALRSFVSGFAKILLVVVGMTAIFLLLAPYDKAIFNTHNVIAFSYIYYFKFGGGTEDQWLMGVSPEGIGFVFMWLAAVVGIAVSFITPEPPQEIQDLVQDIRIPGQRLSHGMAEGGMAPAE